MGLRGTESRMNGGQPLPPPLHLQRLSAPLSHSPQSVLSLLHPALLHLHPGPVWTNVVTDHTSSLLPHNHTASPCPTVPYKDAHRYLPRGPTVCPASPLKLAVVSPRAAGGCWYQTLPGIQWSTGAWLNPGFPLHLEPHLVRLAPSPRRSVSGAGARQHGHHQKSLFLLTGAWGMAPSGCTTFLSFPWPFQAIMFFSTPSSNL